MKRLITLGVLGGLLGMSLSSSQAGIYLESTRIIFPADATQKVGIGVGSSAQSKTPYLVKVQVADTPLAKTPSAAFVTSPSVFRLDPDNLQSVLLLKTGSALPQDRESVFYFRAMATAGDHPTGVAERPVGDIGSEAQVSSMTVIKLFYRPKLALSPAAAGKQIRFRATAAGLTVENPTPYHVTFEGLTVAKTPVTLTANGQSAMMAPFSQRVYTQVPTRGPVEWRIINDHGGVETFNGQVQ